MAWSVTCSLVFYCYEVGFFCAEHQQAAALTGSMLEGLSPHDIRLFFMGRRFSSSSAALTVVARDFLLMCLLLETVRKVRGAEESLEGTAGRVVAHMPD